MIAKAIAYEEAQEAGHEHGVELFTRGVQANIGMGFGVLAFGVAMGALFAVAYCVAYGRVGNLSPRLLSVLLAGGMFLSLYVVPFLKYPANPPAVSLDETIRQRTLLYLLMVVLSAALLAGAVWLGRSLLERFDAWSASLIAAAAYVVAISVVMLALPDHRRDAARTFPPTSCTSSGCIRLAPSWFCGRSSRWCSALRCNGCSQKARERAEAIAAGK